jgi:predicted membrane channel-forming protein YqfA (hemolysin III family)
MISGKVEYCIDNKNSQNIKECNNYYDNRGENIMSGICAVISGLFTIILMFFLFSSSSSTDDKTSGFSMFFLVLTLSCLSSCISYTTSVFTSSSKIKNCEEKLKTAPLC